MKKSSGFRCWVLGVRFLAVGSLFLVTGYWLLVTSLSCAVEVEPLRLEYSLQPGKNYSGSFKLKNSSSFAVDIYISTGEYRYISSSGTIPPSKDEKKDFLSCQDWFHFEKTKFNLSPGGSTEAKFIIKVPQDATEEQVCAVIFDEKRILQEIKRKEKTGNIQIEVTPRFSIPVYISIKGNESISAEIENISSNDESQRGGVIINITLRNTGNIHIRPFGTLVILNQNQEVIKTLPIGKTLPIFPGYKEVIPVICRNLSSGKYTAIATVEISKDKLIQKKSSFAIKK